MAPGQKRKRGEAPDPTGRSDGSQRPSPHRPQTLSLAQQGNQPYYGGRGGTQRRGSSTRGGRGGSGPGSSRPPAVTPTSTHAQGDGPALGSSSSPAAMSAPLPTPAQAATTTAVIAKPVVRPNDPTRPLLPSYYHWYYLTDERLQAWQESGREAVYAQAVKELGEGSVLDILFAELTRAAITERLAGSQAGGLVKDILASESNADYEGLVETFLDTVSLLTAYEHPKQNAPNTAISEVLNPPALRDFLVATNIDPATLRKELEAHVLMACGFVRDTFGRHAIRHQTEILYRQSSFNLLREESEGYAKLMTEYFDASNSRSQSSQVVDQTFERVKSLIGAFSLDPGRVLDVTLDAFANTIIKHNRFFVKFLRASSWWPAEATRSHVQWTKSPVALLPPWAEPDYEERENVEAENARLSELHQQRDVQFWQRVKDVGLDAWFEVGGRRLVEPEDKSKFTRLEQPMPEKGREKDPMPRVVEIDDNNWIGATGEAPPSGNPVAAQLLGFKLRWYASSVRDPSDTLPDVLMNLAALLIKVGFISLRDLYPHLYPSTEEEMAKIKAKLVEEKAERDRKAKPGGGTNALLAAGALTDDTLPAAPLPRLREATGNSTPRPDTAAAEAIKSKEDEKDQLPDPENQVIILLRNLLLIGAVPESLFILGKFPWFMDLYPDLPQYVHRLFHHVISKIYEPLQPLSERSDLRLPKPVVEADKPGLPKGHLAVGEPPPRKALRWAKLEQQNQGGQDYIFYWDHWADNIPVCQNIDDLFLLCNTFLNVSGVKIGQDPALLSKLARIGKYSLSSDTSAENTKRWIDLSKRLLVPSLSLTKSNSPVVNEIFSILQTWPIATRFNIYAEWTTGQTSRLPDIVSAFDQARAQTKDVLKRISKTNTRPMARELAKIADSNPGIVFREAFRQIESYQNMIEVFVECARYLPALGYDVLTWSLMSSLGGNNRSRNQEDGMLTSPWLQALSDFAGSVFKRYPEMHAQSILQYVAWQLKQGNSTDLVVLEQIIDKMAGIGCDIAMNDYQLQAITGGPLLKKQVMEQLQDKRGEVKGTTRRLLHALRQTDDGRPSKLVMQLLIVMAKEIQVFPSRDEVKDAPLKVLGINLDRIYNIFAQYLELLRHNLSIEDFDAQVPDVTQLINEYGVEPEIAWMIARPSMMQRASKIEWPPKPVTSQEVEEGATNADHEMTDAPENAKTEGDASPTTEEGASQNAQNGSHQPDTAPAETEGAKQDGTSSVDLQNGVAESQEALSNVQSDSKPESSVVEREPPTDELLHPASRPYVDRFREILKEGISTDLPISFYVTFWQLQLRDIFVPEKAYHDERTRTLGAYMTLLKKPIPRTVQLREAKAKQEADLKKAADAWEAEAKSEEERVNHTKARLRYEKELWFYLYNTKDAHMALHKALWQDCFFPRILQSGADAHYAFHMLMILHNSGGPTGKAGDKDPKSYEPARPVPGFRLVRLLDDIFQPNALTQMIFACTNREAENFGRFLFKVLEKMYSWHKSKRQYEEEAYGKDRTLIGFTRTVTFDEPKSFMSFEEFKLISYRWNTSVFRALKSCLGSKEYMHIRNAIVVLKQIHSVFPLINFQNTQIKDSLKELHEKDPRPDVKLTAMSCIGDLVKRERFMMTAQSFKGEPDPPKATATTRAASAGQRSSTPQASAGNTGLNAAAAEFKPGANGVTQPGKRKADDDDEEGEIDETRKASEAIAAPATISAAVKAPEDAVKNSANSLPAVPPAKAPAEQKSSLPKAPISRQDDSRRPGTPSGAPVLPPRSDASRPTSTQPPAGRPPHGLPNRPEGRVPNGRGTDRDRNSEYGRLDRPGELLRDERRERSSSRRGRSASPNREGAGYRDRRDGPPSDAPRSDRASRDSAAPRPPVQADSRDAPINPARAAIIEGSIGPSAPTRTSGRNDRANQLDGEARSGGVTRGERDLRDHRPPREYDSRQTDERLSYDNRRLENYQDRATQGAYRDTRGPGNPAQGGRDPQRGGRELLHQPPPSRQPVDLNHGRLSQDFNAPPRHADPNYGRLSESDHSLASNDIPAGPRSRAPPTRGGRNSSGPSGRDTAAVPESPSQDPNPGPQSRIRDRESGRRDARDSETVPSRQSGPQSRSGEPGLSNSLSETSRPSSSRLRNGPSQPGPLQTNNMPAPTGPASPFPAGPAAPQRGSRGPPSGPHSAGPSPVITRRAPLGAPSGPNSSALGERRSDAQQSNPTGGGRDQADERPRERQRESDRQPHGAEHSVERSRDRPSTNDERGSSIRGRASRQASYQGDNGAGAAPGPMGQPASGPPGRGDLMYNRAPHSAEFRDGPGYDERSLRSRNGGSGPSSGSRGGRDDRDARDGERRGYGRDDGMPAQMQPPPFGRQPPRDGYQDWNSGRDGEVRATRSSGRGAPSGGYGREHGEYDRGHGGDRKRGRGNGDEGPSPDMKRLRRDQ